MMKGIVLGLLASIQVSGGILNIEEERMAAKNLDGMVKEKIRKSHEIEAVYDSKQEAVSGVKAGIDALQGQIEDIESIMREKASILEEREKEYKDTLKSLKIAQKEELSQFLSPLQRELCQIKTSAAYREKVGKLVQDLNDYNRSWVEQKSKCRGLWDGIDSLDVGLRINAKEEGIRRAVFEFTGEIEAKIKEREDHFENTRGVYYRIVQNSVYLKIQDLNREISQIMETQAQETLPMRQEIQKLDHQIFHIAKPFLDQMSEIKKIIEIREIEQGS